jgi:hypothetical protein
MYNALIYITLRLHRKVVSITRKVTSLPRGNAAPLPTPQTGR